MHEKSCDKSELFFISGENYAVNEQLIDCLFGRSWSIFHKK